jgi:alpha-glucosidase
LLSFEGAKCLYQGEELGQTETELSYDEIVDPPGLKFWPEYKGRDGCRTPMVWEADAPNAGFSSGTPWLPVKPPQAARAADRQETVPGSILHHYRAVLKFYRETDALRDMGTEWISLDDLVLTFRRGRDAELACVFNLGPEPKRVALDGAAHVIGPSIATLEGEKLSLPAYGYAWLAGRPRFA